MSSPGEAFNEGWNFLRDAFTGKGDWSAPSGAGAWRGDNQWARLVRGWADAEPIGTGRIVAEYDFAYDAAQEYQAYKGDGFSNADALGFTAGTRLPLIRSVFAAAEIINEKSVHPQDGGGDLTLEGYWQRGQMVVSDLVQLLLLDLVGPGEGEAAAGAGEGGDALNSATAASLAEADAPQRGPVHLDIGGEGRHPGAINVNPNTTTSTTGTAGRPIPNLVQATGERLPFGNQVADIITIENTPISQATASQVARVIKPGGEIRLVGPADYAQVAHQRVIQALPPGATVTQTTVGTGETAVTTTIIRVPGGTP